MLLNNLAAKISANQTNGNVYMAFLSKFYANLALEPLELSKKVLQRVIYRSGRGLCPKFQPLKTKILG